MTVEMNLNGDQSLSVLKDGLITLSSGQVRQLLLYTFEIGRRQQ